MSGSRGSVTKQFAPESISHGGPTDLNSEAEKLTTLAELVCPPRRSHPGGPGAS